MISKRAVDDELRGEVAWVAWPDEALAYERTIRSAASGAAPERWSLPGSLIRPPRRQ
jgi:hypothetical protein